MGGIKNVIAENIVLAKAYCFMLMSVIDGKQNNSKLEIIQDILSRDNNIYNLSAEIMAEITIKAIQMFNKDVGDNKVNKQIDEHTQTLIKSLSEKEQDHFLIDIESVAKVDGALTDEEKDMLKQLQTVFEQTREENRITIKADEKNLVNPEVDPLPSTAHKIYALYFYIAHIGIADNSLSDSQINDIYQNTLRENIKEESEQYIRQMVTIFYETHKWFLAVKNEINYEDKIQLLCEQVKGMIPPETLDFVVIDLFISAKVDNRYLEVPERKKNIERLAKIMGVSIQYNGVSPGVHLIGKRAMFDYEGGLDEITGQMSKDELVEGEDSEEANEEEKEINGSDKNNLISVFLGHIAEKHPSFKPVKGKTYGHENFGKGCLFVIGVMKDKIDVEFVSKGKLPASKVMNIVTKSKITSKKMFGKYEILAGPGQKNPTHIRVDGFIPLAQVEDIEKKDVLNETLIMYNEFKILFENLPEVLGK